MAASGPSRNFLEALWSIFALVLVVDIPCEIVQQLERGFHADYNGITTQNVVECLLAPSQSW